MLSVLRSRFALRPSLRRREAISFYICITPWAIGFLAFTLGPLVASFLLAFTRYDAFTAPEWVGLQNYRNIFADELTWQALKVTAYYTFGAVAATAPKV